MGVKRKAKVRQEVGAKVPHDVRQHYVNLFVEEFLKSFVTVQDAFEKVCLKNNALFNALVTFCNVSFSSVSISML